MIGALLALLLAQAPAYGFTPPPGVIIQDEGIDQGRARKLNFAGAGVSCVVTSGTGTCTVAGGGGSTTITQVTVDLGLRAVAGFTASITDATVTGTSKIVPVQDGAAVPASTGTIAFVRTASAVSSANLCTIAVTTSAGDALVVAAGAGQAKGSVLSVSDGGGSFFTRRVANAANAGGFIELWYAQGIAASTAVTVNFSGTASDGTTSCAVAEYSGVATPGAVSTSADLTATSTAPSVSLTTQDTNNFVVAGFEAVSGIGVNPWTATAGTVRSSAANYAVMDNTNALATGVTDSATIAAASSWLGAALELRTTGDGKSADENEMDPFTCSASPAAGSFILNCTAVGTLLTGRYRINYLFQ